MSTPRLIAVIGGTGAQGIPIIRDLVQSGSYTVRALTRDPSSARFTQLQAFGPVEPVVGTFASEADLRAVFRGAWGAFVNLDGFNAGEKTEMYWAIRAYELAIEEGVQVYVYGNLDYTYKKSGYRPEFRAGHLDGKGRIGEWILWQNRENQHRMKAALLTTGPYIEMAISKQTAIPLNVEDGIATWRLPLSTGAIPLTALDDCGVYAKWLFDHPHLASGLNIPASISHISGASLASAFATTTGHPGRYIDTSPEDFFASWRAYGDVQPAGYNADPADPATMSLRDNFAGFWAVWRASGAGEGGEGGVSRKDYALLDEIHPGRIRSAEEWFRREHERGVKAGLGGLWERVQPENMAHVLKLSEDGRSGRL
ncbi:NAD(P)-binding protein [Whalleya microplaca]|nr:NAD(P)-binding protein [Whalleya microplaca]